MGGLQGQVSREEASWDPTCPVPGGLCPHLIAQKPGAWGNRGGKAQTPPLQRSSKQRRGSAELSPGRGTGSAWCPPQ